MHCPYCKSSDIREACEAWRATSQEFDAGENEEVVPLVENQCMACDLSFWTPDEEKEAVDVA